MYNHSVFNKVCATGKKKTQKFETQLLVTINSLKKNKACSKVENALTTSFRVTITV